MRVFTSHFRRKYNTIAVEGGCIDAMIDAVPRPHNKTYAEPQERPIDTDEIRNAVLAGRSKKASGNDGIGLQFYNVNWTAIKDYLNIVVNQMYLEKTIPQQKHGVILCLAKHDRTQTPEDYRPITLLNIHYKILARILARRLQPLLGEYPQTTQFCGVPGNSTLDAVETVRDDIAQSEVTRTPLWYYLWISERLLTGFHTDTCLPS
jgi:hypothetical protein